MIKESSSSQEEEESAQARGLEVRGGARLGASVLVGTRPCGGCV